MNWRDPVLQFLFGGFAVSLTLLVIVLVRAA